MAIDLVAATLWLDMEAHQKLVLVCLCENASLTDGLCWPGRDYTARRASVSPRNVSRHLTNLERAGYIETLNRGRGVGQRTVRRVNVERILTEGRQRQDEFRDGANLARNDSEMVIFPTSLGDLSNRDGDPLDSYGDPSRLQNRQILEPSDQNLYTTVMPSVRGLREKARQQQPPSKPTRPTDNPLRRYR